MKVYVNELPKCCIDCPCYDDESISCSASEKWLDLTIEDNFHRFKQRHKDCPLQSLTDYTKQVRKEVLQEVKVALREKIRLMQSDEHCYPENAIDWHTIVDTIKQIQGE